MSWKSSSFFISLPLASNLSPLASRLSPLNSSAASSKHKTALPLPQHAILGQEDGVHVLARPSEAVDIVYILWQWEHQRSVQGCHSGVVGLAHLKVGRGGAIAHTIVLVRVYTI